MYMYLSFLPPFPSVLLYLSEEQEGEYYMYICKRLVSICFQKRDDGQPTYNVIDVWERNITGAGVVIAVVDEGLDPEHPELKANYVSYSTL